MDSSTRKRRSSALLVVGSVMLALSLAALRLDIGTGGGGEPPSLWLALLFLFGAALTLAVLIERFVAVLRRPKR